MEHYQEGIILLPLNKLVILDALAYYYQFSHNGYMKTVGEFLEEALENHYESCAGVLDFGDSELGMGRTLTVASRFDEIKRLVLIYPNDEFDKKATSSLCLFDPETNECMIIYGGNYSQNYYSYDFAGRGNTVRKVDGISTWSCNFKSAVESDTYEQRIALEFFNKAAAAARKYMEEKGVLKPEEKLKLTVSGHSAAGNQSMYVTIVNTLDNVEIVRCVSVDGQGFSYEFLKKYKLQIRRNASKILSIVPSISIVGSLMNPLPGITVRVIDISDVCGEISVREIAEIIREGSRGKIRYLYDGLRSVLLTYFESHIPLNMFKNDEEMNFKPDGKPSEFFRYLNRVSVRTVNICRKDENVDLDYLLSVIGEFLTTKKLPFASTEHKMSDAWENGVIIREWIKKGLLRFLIAAANVSIHKEGKS